LPADANIEVLENGQFVKYDYASGVVNFGSTEHATGEWMLVFNEVKLYRDGMQYDDFAMKKEDYIARVYSPIDGENPIYGHSRLYSQAAVTEATSNYTANKNKYPEGAAGNRNTVGDANNYVTPADPYEVDSTNDPFNIQRFVGPKMMPTGTNMVPRVFKTNVGDIFTTNAINVAAPTLGQVLEVGSDGFLAAEATGSTETMKWQVVKIYTLADRQPAVKVMRIA
jgi:hypothetical protein